MEIFDIDDIHPDRESYNVIWDNLINKEISNYCSKYTGAITLLPNAKEEIWEKYVSLNKYCKANYMKSSGGKLDRHKVAACYLIAISSVKPMRFVKTSIIEESDKSVFFVSNELLAITIALSILRAYILAAINDKEYLEETQKKELIAKLEGGIKLPDRSFINHGNYMNNFAMEIYFGGEDGNLNILSVAHELFLLEVITRM